MSLKSISRRAFVIDSGSLVGFAAIQASPLLRVLESSAADGPIQYLAESGANLLFYFINTKRRGDLLVPARPNVPSFMVVQVPPQSLHEEFFNSSTPTAPTTQLDARLSGPSFLAFKLWPDQNDTPVPTRKRRIPFDIGAFLDWTNRDWFALQTAADVESGQWQVLRVASDAVNVTVNAADLGYHDLAYYEKVARKVFNAEGTQPITIFELPAGILLTPVDPRRDDTALSAVVWRAAQNHRRHGKATIHEQQFILDRDTKRTRRTITERWSTELTVSHVPRRGDARLSPEQLPPALRAIGLINRGELKLPSAPASPLCGPLPLPDPGSYLPTLLDSHEIVYLNQLGDAVYSTKAFDINVEGAFRLTDLGASLKFRYRNYDTRSISDPAVSLVEYEHHFEAGRDNYIKVARIGLDPRACLRMLHVSIAQRKVIDGVSFLEYREYLDTLERVKVFPDTPEELKYGAGYLSALTSAAGTLRDQTRPLRYPFARVEATTDRSPPIQPVRAKIPNDTPADGADERAFWAYKLGSGTEPGPSDLVRLGRLFYDRNGTPLRQCETPILFLRRDFFCNPDNLVPRWLRGDHNVQSLRRYDDERLRIELANQVLAFTPDDPGESNPNKPNQLLTEWVEWYFSVAQESPGSSRNPFDHATYPAFPQVRRAKVFLDHVQQYAGGKRPSIVEFEDSYLEHKLDATGNAAKLILRHPRDFIDNAVKNLSEREVLKDADIKDGWSAIQASFKGASESLGALVNPDPALERLSLTKSALSLPAVGDVQGAIRQNLIDPRMLFAGRLDAELFAGIKLSDVLLMMGIENAPQFLLSKVPDPLGNIDAILQAASANPVVAGALEAVRNIDAVVARLRQQLQVAVSALEEAERNVQALKADVERLLPTKAKIEAAARAQFEGARLALIGKLDPTPQDLRDFRTLMVMELTRMLEETGAAAPLSFDLVSFLQNEFATRLQETIDKYTRAAADSTLIKEMVEEFTSLKANITVLTARYTRVKADLEATPKTATVLEGLAGLADLSAPAADAFTPLAAAAMRFYEEYKPQLAEDARNRWRDAVNKIDAVRRLSLNYQRERLKRLVQEAEDAARTLPSAVFAKVGTLNSVWDQGKTVRDNLIATWQANPVAAAARASDVVAMRKLVEGELTRLFALLPANDVEAQLRALQSEIDQRLQREVDMLVRRLAAEVARQSTGLVTRFAEEFTRLVGDIQNAEEVRNAMAAYETVTRMLNAVSRQELTTEWATSDFKTTDLGFLQFVPFTAPPTRLTMKSGVRMTLDPLHVPPAVTSTEFYADSLLTAFRIIFLNIIQVDFDRVSFTAGTGKSTQADVKIRSVQFTGSLSFIQKLEELLSGLVNGLRVQIAADHVAVGYQSPSLDISSPGFTFANFSVGVSLIVSFLRRPVELRFSLAEVEKKATIAAGIYGGCFFCTLTLDTKRGIIGSDMALEMGAYFGIKFGPFSGYVKFMVGLRYTRDHEGVTLVGYFIAEGSLSVWVITISARLYMGIRSHNSEATGFCIASLTVKVGFFKKTFRAGYQKRIAGAAQNRGTAGQSRALAVRGIRGVEEASIPAGTPPPSLDRMGDRARTIDRADKKPAVVLQEFADLFVEDFQLLPPRDFALFARKHFAVL